jgi:hypothetical protein
LERARRFERPTLTLARLCSTPELRPLPWVTPIYNCATEPAREKGASVRNNPINFVQQAKFILKYGNWNALSL